MNFSDSEIVASILNQHGFELPIVEEADLVLLNTCSIRESRANCSAATLK
jgi:tRNA-2-methylthio-N6-dimethylallyladenosine synthase